jgi:hypothetical protein
MGHVEREHSKGAGHRDAVVRTVVLAFVSLAAWWCCTNAASADEGAAVDRALTDPPGEADAPAPASPAAGPASLAELPLFAGPPAGAAPGVVPEVVPDGVRGGSGEDVADASSLPGTSGDVGGAGQVVVEGAAEVVPDVVVSDPSGPGPAAAEPILMPTVVVPLVGAASPALAPAGEVLHPVLDAVTTPVAPLVQAVVPVVDRVAGPALAPVAAPLVAVAAPVVEQAGTAAAPVLGLAAPVVDPVAGPVVALVAPLVERVVTAVAAPLVAAVRSVVAPALGAELRDPGPLRSAGPVATAADAGARPGLRAAGGPAALAPAAEGGGHADPVAGGPADRRGPLRALLRAAAGTGGGAGGAAPGAAVLAGAVPAANPFGTPFLPPVPAPRAVTAAPGGADGGKRDPRFVAVLGAAAAVPAVPLSARPGAAAGSPPARSAGRPPVTPD